MVTRRRSEPSPSGTALCSRARSLATRSIVVAPAAGDDGLRHDAGTTVGQHVVAGEQHALAGRARPCCSPGDRGRSRRVRSPRACAALASPSVIDVLPTPPFRLSTLHTREDMR